MSVEILDENPLINTSSGVQAQQNKKKGSSLVRLLMKYGFAKDEKAADIFLIVVLGICVIATAILFFSYSKTSKVVTKLPPRSYMQVSPTQNIVSKTKVN
ncbi:MAG: hypothetical protein WCO48_01405 [Candidatus Taylorbacteria bacterium]